MAATLWRRTPCWLIDRDWLAQPCGRSTREKQKKKNIKLSSPFPQQTTSLTHTYTFSLSPTSHYLLENIKMAAIPAPPPSTHKSINTTGSSSTTTAISTTSHPTPHHPPSQPAHSDSNSQAPNLTTNTNTTTTSSSNSNTNSPTPHQFNFIECSKYLSSRHTAAMEALASNQIPWNEKPELYKPPGVNSLSGGWGSGKYTSMSDGTDFSTSLFNKIDHKLSSSIHPHHPLPPHHHPAHHHHPSPPPPQPPSHQHSNHYSHHHPPSKP